MKRIVLFRLLENNTVEKTGDGQLLPGRSVVTDHLPLASHEIFITPEADQIIGLKRLISSLIILTQHKSCRREATAANWCLYLSVLVFLSSDSLVSGRLVLVIRLDAWVVLTSY